MSGLPSGVRLRPEDHWVTCDRYADPETSRYRHVVRRGGLTTACGATASAPDVWEPVGLRRMRRPYCPRCVRAVGGLIVGDRVRVLSGRWAGRVGTYVGEHTNPGGVRQQGQSYPIVDLDAAGRAPARRVRVLAVEYIHTP